MASPQTPFDRPIPRIGDRTSASTRAAQPDAWAFDPDHISAFDQVLNARRDVRRYRPDPLPEHIVHDILSAGHAAPSVGHSQPWRFVRIESATTKDRAAHLADQARLQQAAKLPPARAQALLDLQLEGIREAPVSIVLLCDRRTKPAGVLGRDTFHDADLWSCACAIQNMWLAARARGVGMGWVTLFSPQDLLDLVGAPPGVTTLGWLCFGYPDERHHEPGLVRAGWSQKLPLAEVILAEHWADHKSTPPTDATQITATDVVAARDQSDTMLTPPGSLGVLSAAVEKVLAAYPKAPTTGHLVVASADHLVADLPVTAYDRSVGKDVLTASQAGTSLGATTAAAANLSFTVLDCGSSTGDLLHHNPLSETAAATLRKRGQSWAKSTATNQIIALGEIGMGNTTIAAAATAALLQLPATEVVGLGAGSDSATVAEKIAVVTAATNRLADQPGLDELLATVTGPEFAFIVGVIQGTAAAGGICVLDGLLTSAAALAAVQSDPRVSRHLIAGPRSKEPAHRAVLTALGLEPLLDIRIRSGEGVGAALSTQMLLTALAARSNTARVHE